MYNKKKFKNRIDVCGKFIFIMLFAGLMTLGSCTSPKVYHVGILSGLSVFAEITDGFKARMTELGYIEGKNIQYHVQKTEFDMEAYNKILKQFIKDKVDLILAFPTEASQQAKQLAQGTGIPVVFASAFTEDTGLVASIQEPGGNITGVRWPGSEIVVRGIEIQFALKPQIKRMIVCYTKGYPIAKHQLEVLRKTAAAAKITLAEIPATSAAEVGNELQKLSGPYDADFIQMIADPILVTPEGFAAAAAVASSRHIPMGGGPMFFGEYQSVYSLTPNALAEGKQAAYLADKIFKGSAAGKIPVLTAEFLFVINYPQAEKIKLNLSEQLLSQADQVIR